MKSLQEAHAVKKSMYITLLVRVEGMEVHECIPSLGLFRSQARAYSSRLSGRKNTVSLSRVGIWYRAFLKQLEVASHSQPWFASITPITYIFSGKATQQGTNKLWLVWSALRKTSWPRWSRRQQWIVGFTFKNKEKLSLDTKVLSSLGCRDDEMIEFRI